MLEFTKGLFSDEGKPDIGPVCTFLSTAAVIGWITHIVWRTHAIPDLTGPGIFMGASASLHAGVNKINDIVTAFKQK